MIFNGFNMPSENNQKKIGRSDMFTLIFYLFPVKTWLNVYEHFAFKIEKIMMKVQLYIVKNEGTDTGAKGAKRAKINFFCPSVRPLGKESQIKLTLKFDIFIILIFITYWQNAMNFFLLFYCFFYFFLLFTVHHKILSLLPITTAEKVASSIECEEEKRSKFLWLEQ